MCVRKRTVSNSSYHYCAIFYLMICGKFKVRSMETTFVIAFYEICPPSQHQAHKGMWNVVS